jgi:hypothetical protein
MQLGSPFKAPKPLTLGLSGFGGASITLQPLLGWREPLRLETYEPASPLSRGLGGSSEAISIQFATRSISSSSREFSAMHSVLDCDR